MRRAFLEAASYAAQRRSFGTTIDSFPMIRERLVWLCVDLAATTALTFYCARALEERETTSSQTAALRFRTLAPVVKYRAGEQNVEFARAAIEMLGGNGYINTFGTPRLLRDAQVNPIWEGTSNICALDLQRAITKQQGHQAVFDHLTGQLDLLADGPAASLAEHVIVAIAQVTAAIDGLAHAPIARREQQARRLADLVGDSVAISALAIEADHEARRDDFGKALTAALFAARRTQPADPVAVITEGWTGVPDLYPALFADPPLSEDDYRLALAPLARRD